MGNCWSRRMCSIRLKRMRSHLLAMKFGIREAFGISAVWRDILKGDSGQFLCAEKEAGLKVLPYFNQRLTGISIDGQIAAAKRDRVQVDMEIDNGGKKESTTGFRTQRLRHLRTGAVGTVCRKTGRVCAFIFR